MKKIFTLFAVLFAMTAFISAQTTVVYCTTLRSDLAATAWAEDNDVVIQMLEADPNFELTVKVLLDGGIDPETSQPVDFSGFDVIILHDGLSSGDAFWTPTGAAALANLPAPTLYGKMYALRAGRALGETSPGASVNAEGVYNLTVVNGDHELFNGIDVSSGVITAMKGGVTDAAETGSRGLQYNTGNVLSAENTLLAYPEGASDAVISFSDIPAGSTIDDVTLSSRVMVMGYNVGVSRNTEYDDQTAFTAEGLTLMRNAVYSLAGITVPETLVDFSFLPTSIFSPSNYETIAAYGVQGGIKVPADMNVSVYTISGELIAKEVNDDFIATKPGIYIVKADKGVAKVAVIK